MTTRISIQTAGVLSALLVVSAVAQGANAQVTTNGRTTTAKEPTGPAGSEIDYQNAKPLPLPKARQPAPTGSDALRGTANPSTVFGNPGVSPGGAGNGAESPEQLAPAKNIAPGSQGSGAAPQDFGTSGQPFSTAEVNAYGNQTSKYYPFRASGKLFFKIGTASYLCSASLIKPGVVVTAAHCVANYGQSQFYSGWQYIPSYNNGTAPYGKWNASYATILTAYYNGSDNCYQFGVICPDDVAVIVLKPKSGAYPGTNTGWFGYGWNGYSYNSSAQAHITQLGYPVDLNSGVLMERNNSQGYTYGSYSNNTILGSLMTGGSSGGPWVVNLGIQPSLGGGDGFGSAPNPNVVVGVTSWGYTDLTVKQQGAAPFTSGNIVNLVNTVCASTPGAC